MIDRNDPKNAEYFRQCQLLKEKYSRLIDEEMAKNKGGKDGESTAIVKRCNQEIKELQRKFGFID